MTLAPSDTSALVLLNGITRSAESWEPMRGHFAGRTTFALDGVGVDCHPAASIPAQARDVLARMGAEGIDSADIVGFSHGGLVAQQLAYVAPERVRSLGLLATSCGTGSTPTELSTGAWTRSMDTDPRDASVIAGQFIAISSWSSIPFLGSLKAPTLVLHGAYDRLVPVENARILARRIPGARLHVLACGHDLQREDRAEIVATHITEFLSSAI